MSDMGQKDNGVVLSAPLAGALSSETAVKTGMACPICGRTMVPYMDDVFDDRYGYPGSFSLERCSRCDLIETAPQLKDEQLPEVYSQYYPRRHVDVAALADQVGEPETRRGRWRRWLMGTDNQGQYLTKAGDVVLDYGCGAAVSLLEIKKLGGIPYGVETDPNVAPIAKHYGLPIHIGRLSNDTFPGIRFNLVVLNQVIEHVPDPGALLKMLSGRLADKGRIVLSFPNTASVNRRISGRAWINWHIPYHLHHFSKKSFRKFAENLGFQVESCRTVTPNLWTLLQFRAFFSRPRMGVPSHMWSGTSDSEQIHERSKMRSAQASKAVTRMRRLARRGLRILAISANVLTLVSNRIADQLGVGDSIIVVLRPANKR